MSTTTTTSQPATSSPLKRLISEHKCLSGYRTAGGVHPAVAALLHSIPARRPEPLSGGANLGRRGLDRFRDPQVATALRSMARLPGARSTVGFVSPGSLLFCLV